MKPPTWKIGELAKLTSLSVRTLHFYEQIGLLRASGRTEAGHRIYNEHDLLRLQRILSLRQLRFSLDEIQACLDEPAYALAPLIDLHLERLASQISHFQRLQLRLTTMRTRLQNDDSIPADQIIAALEAITMLDKYLTPEQIEAVDKLHLQDAELQANSLGDRWKALFQDFEVQVAAAAEPASEEVQALARRWKALSHEATKGDAEFAKSVARMYAERPGARERVGLSTPVWELANRAFALLEA